MIRPSGRQPTALLLVAVLCFWSYNAGRAAQTSSPDVPGPVFGEAVAQIHWQRLKGVLADATVRGRDRGRCVDEYLQWYGESGSVREEAEQIATRLETAFRGPGEAVGVEWVYSKPAGIWFSKTETTVGQFWECSHYGDCSTLHVTTIGEECTWDQRGEKMDYPVNCIEWHGAADFCEWVGGRLPTEEEWYAEASNRGRRHYPWGNDDLDCDHTVWRHDFRSPRGCGRDSPWPVCSKPAGRSVSGLCDLAGNLSEWTSSWCEVGEHRAYRGGNWKRHAPNDMKVAVRGWFPPDGRTEQVGFRCVREPVCFGTEGRFVRE